MQDSWLRRNEAEKNCCWGGLRGNEGEPEREKWAPLEQCSWEAGAPGCGAVCRMEAWAVESGPRQTLHTEVERHGPCPQGAHSLGVEHTVLPTLQQWQELQIQVGGRELRKETSSAWEVQEGVTDHGAEASRLNRSLLERETG